MFYFVKTPAWLKKLYPSCIWNLEKSGQTLYLSFDDGPHPEITPFVLDTLKQYQARATFFCIGKNVASFPDTYTRILQEGHSVGNHTMNHLNGWKTDDKEYLEDIQEASKYIDSLLFRPPYGRASRFQMKLLQSGARKMSIIMWSLLSGDFDLKLSKEKCLNNVVRNAGPGDIIIFHDSLKASDKLRYALPGVLEHFSGIGYRFEKIQI